MVDGRRRHTPAPADADHLAQRTSAVDWSSRRHGTRDDGTDADSTRVGIVGIDGIDGGARGDGGDAGDRDTRHVTGVADADHHRIHVRDSEPDRFRAVAHDGTGAGRVGGAGGDAGHHRSAGRCAGRQPRHPRRPWDDCCTHHADPTAWTGRDGPGPGRHRADHPSRAPAHCRAAHHHPDAADRTTGRRSCPGRRRR